MNYKLHLRYLYTYYGFDEILDTDAIEQKIDVQAAPSRFTLHLQEETSFALSELRTDPCGKNYVVLTFPNKENLLVLEDDEIELAYDEVVDSMGESNHNVYEGTVTLIRE